MLPYRDSRITTLAVIIFFLLVIGYAYYEARGILFGPRIDTPSGVQEVHDQFVHIQGTAERIANLSMDGKSISVTETGHFDEPYLLSPGLNRIILDAKDKYGRSRESVIEIVYTPTSTPPEALPTASTSTSSASTSTVAQ